MWSFMTGLLHLAWFVFRVFPAVAVISSSSLFVAKIYSIARAYHHVLIVPVSVEVSTSGSCESCCQEHSCTASYYVVVCFHFSWFYTYK